MQSEARLFIYLTVVYKTPATCRQCTEYWGCITPILAFKELRVTTHMGELGML
jgi:hypothetical protein